MFKIKKIRIYSNRTLENELCFGDVTYIYGSNKKGKTLILKLIDFILGSSANLLKQNPQGLEHIDFVEADFITDEGEITLARDIKDNFYFKMNNDKMSVVDKGFYEKLISECLCSFDNVTLDSYYNVFNERLTFRALTFLNFLEENGVGNLTCVFTGVNQPKHMFRASEILQFAFERERIEKISHLEETLLNKQKELNDNYRDEIENDFYVSGLRTLFKKYNISFSTDISKNIERILNFKNTLSVSEKPSDGDLNFLIYKSNELSNQIRAQQELGNQSKKIISRNDKFESLAQDIENIFENTPYASNYLNEIKMILCENNYSNRILSLKDYKATIEALKKEKKEYDDKIIVIKNNLSDTSVDEKIRDANQMLEYCDLIKEKTKIRETKSIENEIKTIKTQIKEEKNNIQNSFAPLNQLITKKYLSTSNYNLIKEEKEKNNFKIIFNYKNISSYGEYTKDGKTVPFLPGSSAKMAYWQLCIYLETIKYFKDNLPQMPLLNMIIIDGLNQPFDDENEKDNYFSSIVSIIESFKKYDIQAIIISTDKTDQIKEEIEKIGVCYNINDGLNPLHNQ